MSRIKKSISLIYNSINSGGKIFLCGNGGSAADADHLAAEFIVRLRPKLNRKSIPAVLYQYISYNYVEMIIVSVKYLQEFRGII